MDKKIGSSEKSTEKSIKLYKGEISHPLLERGVKITVESTSKTELLNELNELKKKIKDSNN